MYAEKSLRSNERSHRFTSQNTWAMSSLFSDLPGIRGAEEIGIGGVGDIETTEFKLGRVRSFQPDAASLASQKSGLQ
jgi:hypothetical protein